MRTENKKTGFKVPDDYFESLTSRIMDQVAKEDNAARGNNGFRVPVGYLETFSEKVVPRLGERETQVVPLRPYSKYYYAVASLAAVLILFIGLLWNRDNTLAQPELATSAIEQYFDLNGWEFTSYDLAEILPVRQIDLNEIWEEKLDDEKVVDYLSNNIKDLEELNLEQDD